MAESEITFELPVDPEKVKEFARAVGEENNPLYFDADAAREQGLPGPVAPPTFTVTQIFHVPREEREKRLGANLEYARVLHGEQEFVYKRLPIAGETLKGRCGSRRTSRRKESAAGPCASSPTRPSSPTRMAMRSCALITP